jgi:O-antigen/teichoic acid export membrane protein
MGGQFEKQDGHQSKVQHRVARNAGIYLIVQIISWCVTFVGLAIVPRYLGSVVYGRLLLASTTTALVFNFGSLCIDSYLVREIGRDIRQAERLTQATLGLRLLMIVVMFPANYLVLRSNWVGGQTTDQVTVRLYGLIYFLPFFIGSLNDPLRSALAGREQAREVSLSDFFLASSLLLAVPFLAYGPKTLIYAVIVAQTLTLIIRTFWLRGQVALRPTFNIRLWAQLIRGGVPFMLNNYVGSLYGYVTMLVLNHFMQEAAVAEFNQVTRLTGAFLVVPTAISAALLPVLTRMVDMDSKALVQAQTRVLVVLIVSCLPIIAGVVLLAEPLCHVLYRDRLGDYSHVSQAVQMGALLLLPLYVINVIYQFLVAQSRNGIWSFVLLGTVLLNTVLAWTLVPYTIHRFNNGIAGATLANTIAEFAAMGFAFALLKVNPFAPALLKRVASGAVATAAMALVMWASRYCLSRLPLSLLLSNVLQLVVPAILGMAVFLALAGLLHAFPPQEQEMVVNALRRRFHRSA